MSTLRLQSQAHQAPSIFREPAPAIESHCPLVPRIDLQMKCPDAEQARSLQGEVEYSRSGTAGPRRGYQKEVIHEAVATAMLDAVTQRQNHVSDHLSAATDKPAPRH